MRLLRSMIALGFLILWFQHPLLPRRGTSVLQTLMGTLVPRATYLNVIECHPLITYIDILPSKSICKSCTRPAASPKSTSALQHAASSLTNTIWFEEMALSASVEIRKAAQNTILYLYGANQLNATCSIYIQSSHFLLSEAFHLLSQSFFSYLPCKLKLLTYM